MVGKRWDHEHERRIYRAGFGRQCNGDRDQHTGPHQIRHHNHHRSGTLSHYHVGPGSVQSIHCQHRGDLAVHCHRAGDGYFQLRSHVVRQRGHHQLQRPLHRACHRRFGNHHSDECSGHDPVSHAIVRVQSQATQSRHIVMVMEENTSYVDVVRNSAWPNLNSLIANGALATNYYADSHPSIGNYFMLTTGQLLTTNDNSTVVWNVDNIARRMLAANIPFRIYAEGISQGYLGGDTGLYLIRHNPFAMLSDIASNPAVANQTIWPFTQFATDLANGTLPEFSFIVPDVNDDAHNGTPQQADSWLQTNVVIPVSNSPAFAPGGDGLLIVDFDEAAPSDTTHGGGHVVCVFWGPVAKTGYTQTSSTLYQHESTLHTLMDELGLPNPPGAAASAPSMSELLQK